MSTGHEKMSRSAEPVGPMQSAGNANEKITEVRHCYPVFFFFLFII